MCNPPSDAARYVAGVVHEIAVLDDPRALESLGYEGLGEFGITGRRYFRKNAPTGERTHQIYAFARGSAEIAWHVDFRDYLRAHTAAAAAYASLKRELAARFATDIEGYATAKTAFVRGVEARAARWRGTAG